MGDIDEKFLIEVLTEGFPLDPVDICYSNAEMDNYKSSTDLSVSNKIEKAILNEPRIGSLCHCE